MIQTLIVDGPLKRGQLTAFLASAAASMVPSIASAQRYDDRYERSYQGDDRRYEQRPRYVSRRDDRRYDDRHGLSLIGRKIDR